MLETGDTFGVVMPNERWVHYKCIESVNSGRLLCSFLTAKNKDEEAKAFLGKGAIFTGGKERG